MDPADCNAVGMDQGGHTVKEHFAEKVGMAADRCHGVGAVDPFVGVDCGAQGNDVVEGEGSVFETFV